jgi:hypothetical protein
MAFFCKIFLNFRDEKAQQTIDVESLDSGIQTDSTEPDVSDEILQTDEIETLVEETQTNAPDIKDSQTMTHIATLIVSFEFGKTSRSKLRQANHLPPWYK